MNNNWPTKEQFEQEFYSALLDIIPMASEQKLKEIYSVVYQETMNKPWEELSPDLRLICAQTYTLAEVSRRFNSITAAVVKLSHLLPDEQD